MVVVAWAWGAARLYVTKLRGLVQTLHGRPLCNHRPIMDPLERRLSP